MSDDIIVLARRHTHIASHYEGCEADHIGCLVNKLADEVERQRAEIERLREENKEKQAAFHATHVERDDLRATIKRMREQLKDPNVVALNMLHGKIALPSVEQIKHIYQERFLPPDKATVVSERDEALEGKP